MASTEPLGTGEAPKAHSLGRSLSRAQALEPKATPLGERVASGALSSFGQNRSRGLGSNAPIEGGRPGAPRDMRALRREKAAGLRAQGNTSDAAKSLLSNSDFAKDFAKQAKEINTRRGLTKSQRSTHVKAAKTRLAVEHGNLTGDAAEQALDLSRTSTERGLTSSQRTGLSDASTQLLEGATQENAVDPGSDFELSLLKFFDI